MRTRIPVPAIAATILLAPTPGWATVWHVPQDFSRITDALSAAAAGDVVMVAPGTYSSSGNGEAFPLRITRDISLVGAGMQGSVLDAEGQGSVLWVQAPAARVTGFTVTGGMALDGGGVLIFDGQSPEIDHLLVRGNRAQKTGSGIFVGAGASPWIHHCVVWENRDTDVALPGDPHGIQFYNASGLVEHTVVGRGDSNGLHVNTSTVTIRNNIFYENGIAGVRGRGICAVNGSHPVIAHNLFFGNIMAAILIAPGGGDLSPAQANDLSLTDGVYGNLDGDPLFTNADGWDWRLTPFSPAIDAGDPASALDPDGTRADVGAFYLPHVPNGLPEDRPGGLLFSNTPNPFVAATVFRYTVPASTRVRLTIHDVLGRRVATVVEEEQAPGIHTADWGGTSEHGSRLSPGVYFAILRVGAAQERHKLVVSR